MLKFRVQRKVVKESVKDSVIGQKCQDGKEGVPNNQTLVISTTPSNQREVIASKVKTASTSSRDSTSDLGSMGADAESLCSPSRDLPPSSRSSISDSEKSGQDQRDDSSYIVDSTQDSSSGIASDDHNATSGNSEEASPTTSSFPDNSFSARVGNPTRNKRHVNPKTTSSRDMHRRSSSSLDDLSSSRTSRSSQRTRSPHETVSRSIHRTMQEFLYNGMPREFEAPVAYYPPEYPTSLFELLSDDVLRRIFTCLTSEQKCKCALVCRRWYTVIWDPVLWTTLWINSSEVDADRAVKTLTKRLSYETPTICAIVERVNLNGCERLTDKGLTTIAKRCSELRHLEVQGCPNITNIALFEVVSNCVNLEHLNVAGCPCVTCICLTPSATLQAASYGQQVYLRHLDMTDCFNLEDSGLQIIASYCSQLVYLYLRRCYKITDIGVQYVANYCSNLREFSISDCRNVTDFCLRELSKLESNLRYLSVAKCEKLSDVGVKYIARYCRKLRYLNVRGCEGVSDDSVEMLARSCRRLKSLDIGKCDVTDDGLRVLAEHCPNLRKLSLKSCEAITDRGIVSLVHRCRQLQQLNIQDCHLTPEAYKSIKKYCRRCIIEHSNPGFFC